MGNSDTYGRLRPLCSVHPHVHGELAGAAPGAVGDIGSSPRAWGTRSTADIDRLRVRFIPTCMGNSEADLEGLTETSVHPHVHGELRYIMSEAKTRAGSSPRAWGTRTKSEEGPATIRFIPTCMGNSLSLLFHHNLSTVHPHVHGELTICTITIFTITGSSPRAWGTLYCNLFSC